MGAGIWTESNGERPKRAIMGKAPFLERSPGTALLGASRNVQPAKALPWAQSCTLILVQIITLQSGQDWGKKAQLGGRKIAQLFFCLLVGFACKKVLFKL